MPIYNIYNLLCSCLFKCQAKCTKWVTCPHPAYCPINHELAYCVPTNILQHPGLVNLANLQVTHDCVLCAYSIWSIGHNIICFNFQGVLIPPSIQ